MRSPLMVVAALVAYALVDDAACIECCWRSLHAVMAAVWPASSSKARARGLKRDNWVPPPPRAAAGAPVARASGGRSTAPPPSPQGRPLAAALAADLASHAPGSELPALRAAAQTIMACKFAAEEQLGEPQMQQLLVLVHDVPAGRGAGCIQLTRVAQAAAHAFGMTAPRHERLTAYLDGAQALAAASGCECWVNG